MDRKSIEKYIEKNEGTRYVRYKDIFGIPTVGIGHNLKTPNSPKQIVSLGLDYQEVLDGREQLTQKQVSDLFQQDLDVTITDLKNYFPDIEQYPNNICTVLCDLMFNLGNTRFSQFKHFIFYIKKKDVGSAIGSLQNSLWAKQLPSRCKKNCDLLSKGFP